MAAVSPWQLSQTQVVRSFVVVLISFSPFVLDTEKDRNRRYPEGVRGVALRCRRSTAAAMSSGDRRRPMGVTTFVLIPGAGGQAWYWHRVVAELERRGHDAVAVDLPSGDDSAGLAAYTDAVVAAIDGRTPVD